MSDIKNKYLVNSLVGDYQKLTQDIMMYENELDTRDRKWQEIDYIKKGGKLVFHLPRFHIVDKQNYKKYLKKKISSESYDF